MDIVAILQWLYQGVAAQPWGLIVTQVMAGIGTVVTLCTVIIRLTPTKKDDELLDSVESGPLGGIIKFIENFSLIERKSEAQK